MSSKPTRGVAPTPTIGTAQQPVTRVFSGPDVQGFLNDVPPIFPIPGSSEIPLKIVTGPGGQLLGSGTEVSPKTHG